MTSRSFYCRLLSAGIIVTVGACTSASSGRADSSAANADVTDETPTQAVVRAGVVPVQVARFDETLDAVGTIAGRPGRVAQLAAPGATRVTRVVAAVGQSVRAGDALVELESTPFESAKSSADRALEVAERAQARAQRLADAGVLPRKEADIASADLAAAQSAATTARRARDLAVLRAPFAGVVTRQLALVGASVDASQPLVELSDMNAQDVLLTFSPTDVTGVRVGGSVTLWSGGDAGAAGSAPVGIGHVTEVGAAVDSASGGVLVRVAVTTRSRVLRFGESVVGRVAVATHDAALLVSPEALVPHGEGYRVFVVDSTGVAHAVDVQVGGRSATAVWIRDGLTPGMRVVASGAYGMDDGAKVVPVKP